MSRVRVLDRVRQRLAGQVEHGRLDLRRQPLARDLQGDRHRRASGDIAQRPRQSAAVEHPRAQATRDLAQLGHRRRDLPDRLVERDARAAGVRAELALRVAQCQPECQQALLCAVVCRSRSSLRRSASAAATMRAREVSTSASCTRTSTRRRASSIGSAADRTMLCDVSVRRSSFGSWTITPSSSSPRLTSVYTRFLVVGQCGQATRRIGIAAARREAQENTSSPRSPSARARIVSHSLRLPRGPLEHRR